MAPGQLPVVLRAPQRVTEDRPGVIEPLHLVVVAFDVGVEDPGQHAVGRLDHERIRSRIDLQDAVEAFALRHGGKDDRRVRSG
jgi:hypothetical protein